MERPRVVIVGAGFAGLNAARALAGVPVDITIVDRRNFHLFQPLLYQVATAALNPSDIAYPIRSVFRDQQNIRSILLGQVTSVDRHDKVITIDHAEHLGYDYLIVATGATHSYFGNDEWEELAPGLKSIEDALLIRRRILEAFESAERNPVEAAEYLTFAVIGAGPTGVELAGALIEIAIHALEDEFDAIDPARARVLLIEGTPDVLPSYPPKLRQRARRQLEDLGVEVMTDSLVTAVDDTSITLESGERIATRTILWAAGVQASGLSRQLDTTLDRAGRVVVGPDLSITDDPSVFAIGDLASVKWGDDPVPGVAPAAIQQGRHAARMIRADITGGTRRPFRYRDKGSLATIGRARGVADLPGVAFSGFAAWAAWLGIHIFFLIGFRNRVFVFLSWAWNYVTFRRGARIITRIGTSTRRA